MVIMHHTCCCTRKGGSSVIKYYIYTGCPTKNYTLFWGAVAPSKLGLFSNVRGVSESSRPKLSNEY